LQGGTHYANIDVLFSYVVAVYVEQTYLSILVRRASTEEIDQKRAAAGIDSLTGLQYYVLGKHLTDGWVQRGAVLAAEEQLGPMQVSLSPPGASSMPPGWQPLANPVVLAMDPPEEDLFSSQEADAVLHPP
jgi:hypothetical protein